MKCLVKTPYDSLDLIGLSGRVDEKEEILCATHANSLLFYSAGSGELLDKVDNAHASVVRSLCFAPGGKYLFTCGDDRLIKMWTVPKVGKLVQSG